MSASGTRCGTASGWRKHQLAGDKPCDACTRAKAEYDKRYRSATDRQRKSRLTSRAQSKATVRLRRLYPDEWKILYAQAMAEVNDEAEEES